MSMINPTGPVEAQDVMAIIEILRKILMAITEHSVKVMRIQEALLAALPAPKKEGGA